MTGDAALVEIKRLAARGAVVFRAHARQRMNERGAVADDVINALRTATAATGRRTATSKVSGGVDLDREDLTVVVDIEADVIVVTIF